MIRKTTLFKRKFKGIAQIVFFSFLIFAGVFVICFGIWFYVKNHAPLKSPLAKIISGKKTLAAANAIQSLCLEDHLNCTSVVIHQDNTATVIIDTNEEIIFSLTKDIFQQFTSLQLTIAHLTIEGKRFSRFDFRFDNPVITY